jgi:hypothetical protein
MMRRNLLDELFFFMYHLRISKAEWLALEIFERKYLIDKYIQQKNLEREEIDKERKKANRRR